MTYGQDWDDPKWDDNEGCTHELYNPWFVPGICIMCEEPKMVFNDTSDSHSLCEDCWLGTK